MVGNIVVAHLLGVGIEPSSEFANNHEPRPVATSGLEGRTFHAIPTDADCLSSLARRSPSCFWCADRRPGLSLP